MSVETFLGYKKMIVSKRLRDRQPHDLVNLLFLAVFACAYVYFPYSAPVRKKNKIELKADVFSPQPVLKLMSPIEKNQVSFRSASNRKTSHYVDEPLCQLVARARKQRLKARQLLSRRGPKIVKRSHENKMKNTEERHINQEKHEPKDRSIKNPNRNHGSASQRMFINPNPQVSLNEEIVNPNSLVIGNSSDALSLNEDEEQKGAIHSALLNEGEIIQKQPQQQLQNLKEIKSLQNTSLLMKTSILDSQQRIAQLSDSNQKLIVELKERDVMLQEKDDLIMGIQVQLMSYESVLGNTPGGDFFHEDALAMELRNNHRRELAIELRNNHKRELHHLKKQWMEKELEQEKRISNLLAALKFERERTRVLKSSISEGPYEKTQVKEWSKPIRYIDEAPEKLASPDPILSGIRFSDSQQMQIESRTSRSSRTSGLDIEMEDESMEFATDPELGKPDTAIEFLRKRNIELQSQIHESNMTIGELNGEMRELECLNMQLSTKLEQEPGMNMMENTNSRSTQTQPGQREGRKQTKPRKLFNVPKFLSCRKVETDEIFNTCDTRSEHRRVLVSHV